MQYPTTAGDAAACAAVYHIEAQYGTHKLLKLKSWLVVHAYGVYTYPFPYISLGTQLLL